MLDPRTCFRLCLVKKHTWARGGWVYGRFVLKVLKCLKFAAVGVDDVFVLISAWRRTPHNDPVDKRLAAALRDAGVSITVTSLTDSNNRNPIFFTLPATILNGRLRMECVKFACA